MTLYRRWYDADRTIGELYDGREFVAFTMEPGRLDTKAPRVPAGFYYLEPHGWEEGTALRFKQTWALVGQDVSHQREMGIPRCAVLLHAGNRDEDTLGCILVGMVVGRSRGETALISSREAMDRLRGILGPHPGLLVIRG